MSQIFRLPRQVQITSAGIPVPAAKAYIYLTGTSTLASVWTDKALSVSGANPIVADAAGVFPLRWLDESIVYKLMLNTAADVLLYSEDPAFDPTPTIVSSTAIKYDRTAAEIAAGVTPVNYAIQNHMVAGVFYPERYATNTTPGTTNMAAAIQTCNSVAVQAGGGTIWCNDSTYYLGRTAVTLSAGVSLYMQFGGKFTADTSVVGSMPAAYLVLSGSNITVDGAYLDFVTSPYSAYSLNGAFMQIGADNLTNIEIKNCRSRWVLHSVYGSHLATTANSCSHLKIHHNDFVSADADVYFTGKSPSFVTIEDNVYDTARGAYLRVGGAVHFAPAVDVANVANFTESNYDNDYGNVISISRNQLGRVVGRPIRVMNCITAAIDDNVCAFKEGGTFTPNGPTNLYTSDNITLELVRDFTVNGNTIQGGGENHLDFLSCQDGVATGNTLKRCNTNGVHFGYSDIYVGGGAAFTDKRKLLNRDLTVTDNYIEAYLPMAYYQGQNIRFGLNQLKLYRGSTNWAVSETAYMLFDNSTAPSPTVFGTDTSLFPDGLDFSGNQRVTYAGKSCTFNAGTDVVTSAVAHEFTTGDKIDLIAAGTSTTVDFPAGVNYYAQFYVIVLSTTTFKLATTYANAIAATAIDITSNGLTTGGSAIFAREAVKAAIISWSASYYSASASIVLDPNFPGVLSTDLFSTLGTITTNALLLRNRKHEHIMAPATAYGGGPDAKGSCPVYLPVSDRIVSNGTNTQGIEATDNVPASLVLGKGTVISRYSGQPADGYIRTYVW